MRSGGGGGGLLDPNFGQPKSEVSISGGGGGGGFLDDEILDFKKIFYLGGAFLNAEIWT